MTTFNGTTVVNRQNRPSPLSKTKLDFYFVKDGVYTNPFQVCSVHIFPNTQFGAPDQYLDLNADSTNYGLVSATGQEKMVFRNINFPAFTPCAEPSGFPAPSAYDGTSNTASSIYLTDAGHFSVILQTGTEFFPLSSTAASDPTFTNSASATGGYIDIWTVVDAEGSKAQIYVNTFNLDTANVFTTSEPIEVTTQNKLVNRYIDVGSKEKLRMKTHLVIDNEPIRESLRNLMETGSLLQSPEIKITKLNETPNLTSRVVVTGSGGTPGFISSGVEVDSHGTISYLWDTNAIAALSAEDNLGSTTGVYEVQAKFTILDSTIYSPKFKLIVR
jgi:hypothetical protein